MISKKGAITVRLLLSFLVALSSVSCTQADTGGPILVNGLAGASPPTLEPLAIGDSVDTLIWRAGNFIAVLDSGAVALSGSVYGKGRDSLQLHVVNPYTGQITSMARRGEGPGEVLITGSIFSQDSLLDLFTPNRMALVRYSVSGAYRDESSTSGMNGFPLGAFHDSLDVQAEHGDVLLMRRDRRSMGGRPLVTLADSFIQHTFNATGKKGSADDFQLLPYAVNESGFVIGYPRTYTLGFYSHSGTLTQQFRVSLPPLRRSPTQLEAQKKELESLLADPQLQAPASRKAFQDRLDTLDRETLPHFDQEGLHFDGRGRLWVIGAIGEDSTFADVFEGQSYLGRRVIPCQTPKRRISLKGEWLALLCEAPAESNQRFTLQVYHIIQ